MTHYEESAEGITKHFDRGQPPVRAKLLIGADGYFSHIRQQCLADGPPQFVVSPWTQHYLCLALNLLDLVTNTQ